MTRNIVRAAVLCSVVLWAGCGPSGDQLPEAPPGLSYTALPACEAAVPSPGAFRDALPGSGIDFVHSVEGLAHTEDQLSRDEHMAELAGGVVAADFDGDGWSDLFFPQSVGANALYWGGPELTFVRADEDSGVSLADELSGVASAADYDGDGLLDLVVLGTDRFHLFHNEGDRTFRDVTASLGMTSTVGTGTATAWADFDGDGDLDLYSGVYGVDSRLYEGWLATAWDSLWRNDGDRFTDVASSLPYPTDSDGAVIHALWHDVDDDGDPDLLQVNDWGTFVDSFFWENLGADGAGSWLWVDRKPDALSTVLAFPMGMAVTDLDDDGITDLWFSNIGATQAFSGEAAGGWGYIDQSAGWPLELPTGSTAVSWSVVAVDLDGSGEPGLLLTFGPLAKDPAHVAEAFPDPSVYLEQPDAFLVPGRDGAGNRSFGLDNSVFPAAMIGNARGVALSDFNRDGVPDVVIANLGGPPALLVGQCTAATRVAIDLRDPTSGNHYAVGARVTVEAAGRRQSREVLGGGPGTFSGNGPQLLFGIGEAERIERLSVRWPGGSEDSWQDLCGNCRIVLTRR